MVRGLGTECGTFGLASCSTAAVRHLPLRVEPAEELAQGRERAGKRAADGASAAARGEEGAKGLGLEPLQVGEAGRVAEVGREVGEELAHIARVGVERLFRSPSLVAQVSEPVADGPVEIGAQRQLDGFIGGSGHDGSDRQRPRVHPIDTRFGPTPRRAARAVRRWSAAGPPAHRCAPGAAAPARCRAG